MQEFILNYYPLFKCIAGSCKHTCCAGWKMCIDEQSLVAYKNDTSAFYKVLKKGINFRKSSFKADKKGRCAFLNDKGLCEIIINLGEQSLCQVCRDHPRFKSFFNDRVETGLGFCCEAAAKMILSFGDKITLISIKNDGNQQENDFNQKNILAFREKVLLTLQDRNIPIDDRIDSLLTECKASVLDKDFSKIIKRFLSLERLNKSWTKRLKGASKNFTKRADEKLSLYAEQFLVNSIYRHLTDAEDTMWVRARTIACVLSWWVINSIIENEKGEKQEVLSLTADVVREFSAEVEYSQNNLDKLFDFAYKFIKL
ncbi:MAG: hypothetical protein E7340_01865 [Clostridiales bacterium]|nr:hypothetical protein [Clostridiales bacterium]